MQIKQYFPIFVLAEEMCLPGLQTNKFLVEGFLSFVQVKSYMQ